MYDLSTIRHIRIDLPNPEPIRFDLSKIDFDWAKREPIDLILPSFKPAELHFFPYSPSTSGRWSADPFYIDFPWERPSSFKFQREENFLSSLVAKDYLGRDLTQFIRSDTPFFRPYLLDLPKLEFHIPESEPDYLELPQIELSLPYQEPISFELPTINLKYHDSLPRDFIGNLVPPPGLEPGPTAPGYLPAGSTIADYHLAGLHSYDYFNSLNRPLAQRIMPTAFQPYAPMSFSLTGSPPPRTALWGW